MFMAELVPDWELRLPIPPRREESRTGFEGLFVAEPNMLLYA